MGLINFGRRVFFGIKPKRWLGYNQIASHYQDIKQLTKRLHRVSSETAAQQPDTFQACMDHYGISASDIPKRMRIAKCLGLLYVVLVIVVLIYMAHWFLSGFLLPGIVCCVLSLLLGLYGFCELFSYCQMKEKRLDILWYQVFTLLFSRR